MKLLHEPVPRLRGILKVAYANNWRCSYVQLARWKELNPHAEGEALKLYTRTVLESDSKAA
jgi:hypothetical protein